MRLLATADLHGLRQAFSSFAQHLRDDDYDFGIIAGDLMTHFSYQEVEDLLEQVGAKPDDLLEELPAEEFSATTKESNRDRIFREGLALKEKELRSILETSQVPIYFVMGNDDGIVAGGREWKTGGTLFNVNQKRLEFGNYNIVGYQYTNPFVGGLFEKEETDQDNDLELLRPLIDEHTILITHGPPYGILDTIGPQGESLGSKALRKLVASCKPYLHIFGHIHQANGVNWPSINVAYPPVSSFISIDLETKRTSWIATQK